jgi:hypothetical protein
LKEAEKLSPQQLSAPLANKQPPTPFDLLMKAKIVGVAATFMKDRFALYFA